MAATTTLHLVATPEGLEIVTAPPTDAPHLAVVECDPRTPTSQLAEDAADASTLLAPGPDPLARLRHAFPDGTAAATLRLGALIARRGARTGERVILGPHDTPQLREAALFAQGEIPAAATAFAQRAARAALNPGLRNPPRAALVLTDRTGRRRGGPNHEPALRIAERIDADIAAGHTGTVLGTAALLDELAEAARALVDEETLAGRRRRASAPAP